MILVHPDHAIDLEAILGLIQDQAGILDTLACQGGKKTLDDPLADPARSDRPDDCAQQSHVSGLALAVSGVYLAGLMIRRAVVPVAPAAGLLAGVITLPAALTLWLAAPIQRRALEHFRETSQPDMGLISTGLLYVSLLTGNVATAFLVAWLYNLAGWTETRVKDHTCRQVRDMLTRRQTRAWKLMDHVPVEVDAKDLVPGDIIVLDQGHAVPADGIVIDGRALVNEAAMTGESLPVAKSPAQTVLAGTLVEEGRVHVRVEKTGDQTRMAAILRLIASAQADTGPTGRASIRLSQAMVPVSLGIAGLVFLSTGALYPAMVALMVTCPCALRLSASASVSSAMGRAASQGILIKGGSHVETAGQVDILVLDKTGTLTDPVSRVTRIAVLDRRYKQETILRIAAAALQPWQHPLSRAVVRTAVEQGLDLPPCEDRKLFVGLGCEARMSLGQGQRAVLAGSRRFMEDRGVSVTDGRAEPPHITAGPDRPARAGDAFWGAAESSTVYLALDHHLVGRIHAAHRIREDATPGTMARLRQAGVSTIAMLTGDTQANAMELAAALDFDEVRWAMSPEDKARWIQQKKQAHPRAVIAMVGDGINDTPAFAQSHLSVAVGEAGEDLTLEYADVVLQQGGLGSVAATLEQGRDSLARIKQSYAMAVGANLMILGLMGLGLMPPLTAALAHNLVTIGAVANAARPAALPKESGQPAKELL